MCGYCVEGTVLLEYLESKTVESTSNGLPVILQEAGDYHEIIQRLTTTECFGDTIDIAFCRLVSQLIENGFDDDPYRRLGIAYSPSVIAGFLQKLGGLPEDRLLWRSLGDERLYQDNEAWQQFINNTGLIDASERILLDYVDGWLNKNDEDLALPYKAADGGKDQPAENEPNRDWQWFKENFPIVFFALSYLSKYKPQSKILIDIALTNPGVPHFHGRDLWLQRKAFTVCVQQHGFGFIGLHFNRIRMELLAYALLKGNIEAGNIGQLSSLLSTQPNDGVICISPKQLGLLIERHRFQ